MANFLSNLFSRRDVAAPPGDVSDAALPAVVDVPQTDLGRAGRLGLWAVGLGFGGFLLWAAFAPLDEGVPSPGMVSVDTKRKTVQHLTGGIIKQVLVREGELVKEGQVLVRLDEAATRAAYESIRQRYLGLRATQGRLLAEQAGQSKVTFHPDLKAAESDPLIRHQMLTQEQLFTARRSALQADIQALQETLQGQRALIQSYTSMLGGRKQQIALVTEELTNTRSLVKEGYAPRNRQLELERMLTESNMGLSELQGNLERAHRSIAEVQQRIIQRQQEYRKEVETQLGEVTREVEADEVRFQAARGDLDRIEIRSPATGQVVSLAYQTVGGVIPPGQKLMDIVPEGQPLLLETQVPPHVIDRVHAGLPVDIRFSTFPNAPQLVVEGKVESISHDVIIDPQGQRQYYLARVALTPEGKQRLGRNVLQPGMPVELVLKTGERTLLAYILHPLTKRIAASMKEV